MSQETFPLTPLQEGMLLHSLAAPETGVYVQQMVCDLEESLDTVAFLRAWGQLAERHDAVRLSFALDVPGSPRQRFHRQINIPWKEEDWRGRSEAHQREQLDAFLEADRWRGFDLTESPLFRLALFRLDQAHFQLVWTSHHALLDGRSRLILLEELFEIYEATRDGRTPALAPAPSFRRYTEWLNARDTSSATPFWRGMFAGRERPSLLGSGSTRGGHPGSVAKQSVRLPRPLTERLRSLAAANGLTLNTLLQGAWAILLSRYAAQRAVAFGATRAGRHGETPATPRAVGLFINTLPMVVDVDPDVLLLSWLAGLRASWVALRPHEHTSLVDIRQWAGVAPGTELFDSLVVFENYELNSQLRERGDQWQQRTFRLRGRTNYPLVLAGYDGAEILLDIDYDARRFDADAIRRMLDHLETLLTGFAAQPERTLAEIPLLTERERHQLLVEWNDTTVEYPCDRCVHELFESQAERSPDSVAVVTDDRHLTYAELNEHANQLAHHLGSLGVGTNTTVGLCLERSPALVIAVLAVLKAGGTYVPLDPDWPSDRLAWMLEDAAATHLVSATSLLGRLPVTGAQLVCVDRDAAVIQSADRSNPRVNIGRADDVAYVMFTSGSTGRPKGVAIRHTAIARLVFGTTYATFGPDRVFLQLAPASFDASTFEIWGALLHGARLVVAPHGAPDFPHLRTLLARHAVTTVFLTTSLFNQIIDDCPEMLDGVGEVLTGGEVMSVKHVRRAQAVLGPGVQLSNVYGPTEGTTFTTCYRIPRDLSADVDAIPIGRPIANTQVYVLDSHGAPVPIGVSGELYIGGAGVALGYLHRPALTAERFVPDPFSSQPAARLYRSGDYGHWRADGQLEFHGRLDDQIKLRGFRIELGEIEAALAEHPEIARSVVALRADTSGEPRLVAYCVLARGVDLDVAGLTRRLTSRLPDYMLPADYVALDALPMTPGGKIDRSALPAPNISHPRHIASSAAPRTPIEQQLVSLWSEVLAIEDIGIHDNFFALGGHSLLAARVNARIVAALQVDLPLRTLFEAPTVAELSQKIDALRRGGHVPHDRPLKRIERQPNERLVLSFAQQRLWLLEQLEGGLTAYNMPSGWRLLGPLDAEALRRALETVVRRHEPLRTTFTLGAGEPAQVVRDVGRFELPIEDLSDLAAEQQAEEVARRRRNEVSRPFDLTADLMVRASLLRLGEHEHVLLLTMHHIASDGWSLSVLWRELGLIYESFGLGVNRDLPDLPVRYADFAAWQRSELEDSRLERMVQYWRQQLKGVVALDLPADRKRPTIPTYRGARREFEIDEDLVSRLKALSQRESVTLQMTLLAAFQTLLTRSTGQQDLAVGAPTAGRNHESIEGLIGYFVNILVLRTDMSGDPTFRELLKRVRAVSLEAYDHQDLPFERLVEELQPQRHASRSPLVQVLFQLLTFSNTDLTLPHLQVSRLPLRHQRVRFDLEMHLWQHARTIRGILVYSMDLFDAPSIDRLVDQFLTLLAGIVAAPNRRLSELPMLTDAERRQLLVEWNDTNAAYPGDRCVHELFETQVDRTPDAIALVSGEHHWTYREVNRAANRLAHYLRRRGVGSGALVGLAVERSAELIVGVLAILKAGAAYVPLDVDLPQIRLDTMTRDCGVAFVVTRRRFLDRLTTLSAAAICLDDDLASRGDDTANPDVAGRADAVAYVMFTSGSTGAPKGVAVRHAAIARLVFGQTYATFGPDRVFLQLAPASFDASTFEIWGALLHGARLVMAPAGPPDFRQLRTLLARHGVTTVWLTASLFNQIIDDCPEMLAGVGEVLTGGEALSVKHVRRAQETLGPGVQLINGYGPTEGTTFTTCYRIPRDLSADLDAIPIGQPIANTRVYVLDAHGTPVPVGVAGELYIGGAGVAEGYLHRPAVTAERFVPDPFSDQPGARLYRTGDFGCWRADGQLGFHGRRDDQIKLRGFRIELGEIEVALAQHPSVAQCVVAVRDVGSGAGLLAYVVAANPAGVVPSELRDHLRSRLPDYMLPARFVALERLPLTPSGKVDRDALPAVGGASIEPLTDFVPPRSRVEGRLAALWRELLRCERVGVHDEFFAMGGHSLLAVRLFVRIEQEFGRRLPLAVLFQKGTIAHLAALIEEARPSAEIASAVPLQTSAAGRPLFVLPTIGGELTFCPALVEQLGNEFQIVGLQPALEPEHLQEFRDFRATAARFTAALRAHQPRGPYALLGYSYGGLLAFEVASILLEAGEAVDLLAVLDTGPNGRGTESSVRDHWRRWARIVVNSPAWLREEMSDFSARRLIGSAVRRVRGFYRTKVLGRRLALDDVFDIDGIQSRNHELMRTVFAALHDYVPRAYPGTLTLFRATVDPLLRGFEPDLGWSRLVDKLELRYVRGNHETILHAHRSGELAGQLAALLRARVPDVVPMQELTRPRGAERRI